MKEIIRKHSLTILFLLSLLAAVTVIIYGGNTFDTNDTDLHLGTTDTLSTGWYYLDGDKQVDIQKLPASFEYAASNSITLHRVLPETLPENAALCVESYHQILEVFIGNTLIYDYGLENKAPVGRILGNVWNVIDLPNDAMGQELSLRVTTPYTSGEWHISDVLLGSRSAVLQTLWSSCAGIAVFALLSGALGLFFLLLSLLLKWKRLDFNRQGFLHLGFFILLSTLWIVTDSKIPQFLVSNSAALYLMSFLSFKLMPVPFLFFFRQLSKHGKKLLETLSLLFILDAILCTVLYLNGLADFVATLPITHILMIATIICALIICLRERFLYKNRETGFVLAGICVLLAGGLTSLVTFNPLEGSDNSLFFRFGLILFFILLCYGSFKRGVSLLRTSMKAETYRYLAYTDTMTQLGNRAAFDRDAEALQKNVRGGSLTVAVFDINSLKFANDTYGHAAGDNLIKGTAHCIEEVFSPLGKCYRIGGDEFVVIMQGVNEVQISESFIQFKDCITSYDTGNSNGLHVANGCATGRPTGSDFVYQLFRQADAKMYEQKDNTVRTKLT